MDRVKLLAHNPDGHQQLHAVDGGPGTGKTTTIVQFLKSDEVKGKNVGVVTYSKAAARVLMERMADVEDVSLIEVGTVYVLSWHRGVSAFAGKKKTGSRGIAPWGERKTRNKTDPMIERYKDTAPSARPKTAATKRAIDLHAWDGKGDAPFNLKKATVARELRFLLPLARWTVEGACSDPFDLLILDEAQDFSPMELAGCLKLLAQDGEAWAFLDPGQAIYSATKWGKTGLPPAWTEAGHHHQIEGGFRVGSPVSRYAAKVLKPVFDRNSSVFNAKQGTSLHLWTTGFAPERGLVLGLSRAAVADYAVSMGKNPSFALTSGVRGADPNKETVFSVIHAAKGAEADEVYLLDWNDDWHRKLLTRDKSARQILYVAMTRAKRELWVSPMLYEIIQCL